MIGVVSVRHFLFWLESVALHLTLSFIVAIAKEV
jgi:hypothetical protein